eukprot:TRINITY_DN16247_c0_g1_i1.p1 TRINITY_DN16247_c0_g1~~TRINITY_DN16247_c0_g1_i1.p1  ORF type:complete len:471 (+),score=61.46 TRINITY_DN16247_c0_g1_i1:65-1477(+)
MCIRDRYQRRVHGGLNQRIRARTFHQTNNKPLNRLDLQQQQQPSQSHCRQQQRNQRNQLAHSLQHRSVLYKMFYNIKIDLSRLEHHGYATKTRTKIKIPTTTVNKSSSGKNTPRGEASPRNNSNQPFYYLPKRPQISTAPLNERWKPSTSQVTPQSMTASQSNIFFQSPFAQAAKTQASSPSKNATKDRFFKSEYGPKVFKRQASQRAYVSPENLAAAVSEQSTQVPKLAKLPKSPPESSGGGRKFRILTKNLYATGSNDAATTMMKTSANMNANNVTNTSAAMADKADASDAANFFRTNLNKYRVKSRVSGDLSHIQRNIMAAQSQPKKSPQDNQEELNRFEAKISRLIKTRMQEARFQDEYFQDYNVRDLHFVKKRQQIERLFGNESLTFDERKNVFRKLLLEFHPDKNFHEKELAENIFHYLHTNKDRFLRSRENLETIKKRAWNHRSAKMEHAETVYEDWDQMSYI